MTKQQREIVRAVEAVIMIILVTLGCFFIDGLIMCSLVIPLTFLALAKNRRQSKSALISMLASLVTLETLGILHKLELIYISRFAQEVTMTLAIDVALIVTAVVYGFICSKPKKGEKDVKFARFLMIKRYVCYSLLGLLAIFMITAITHKPVEAMATLKAGQRVIITPVDNERQAVTIFDRLDVHLSEKRYKEAQIFTLLDVEDGYFQFEAYNEENVLDIYDNRYEVGTPLIEWFNLDADNQKWKILYLENKGYVMYSKAANGLYISVAEDGQSMVMSDISGAGIYFNIECYSRWGALMTISDNKPVCVAVLIFIILACAYLVLNDIGVISRGAHKKADASTMADNIPESGNGEEK